MLGCLSLCFCVTPGRLWGVFFFTRPNPQLLKSLGPKPAVSSFSKEGALTGGLRPGLGGGLALPSGAQPPPGGPPFSGPGFSTLKGDLGYTEPELWKSKDEPHWTLLRESFR